MIKLWRKEAMDFDHRQKINPNFLELETAKEILREVFHTCPSDIEDIIQKRLEEKNWCEKSWQEEEELWPASFGVSE